MTFHTLEHYDSDEHDNELIYIIVEPTYDPGERQTYEHPGCPSSVDFDKAYLKGDPEETDVLAGPVMTPSQLALLNRIETTLFEYFDGVESDREESDYYDRQDKLNG